MRISHGKRMGIKKQWSKIVICGAILTTLGLFFLELNKMHVKMTGLQLNFKAFAADYAAHPEQKDKYRNRFEIFSLKMDKKYRMEEEFVQLFEGRRKSLGLSKMTNKNIAQKEN